MRRATGAGGESMPQYTVGGGADPGGPTIGPPRANAAGAGNPRTRPNDPGRYEDGRFAVHPEPGNRGARFDEIREINRQLSVQVHLARRFLPGIPSQPVERSDP